MSERVRKLSKGIQEMIQAGKESLSAMSGDAESSPLGGGSTPLTQLSRALRTKPNFQKLRTAATMGVTTSEDKHVHMETQAKIKFSYWRILVATAILSSSLSFGIDNFNWVMGLWRSQFTNFSNIGGLIGIICTNVIMVIGARLIVRTTTECEGSGFPEMKAMLFGHVLDNYLTLRVLFIKAIGLAMLVSAGLPVGKEGPNCHMAACIARNLDPEFINKRQQSAQGTSQISKLFLAAVSVGVGASFSAPIGGVIFSLELMLPQIYDYQSYWGCFCAGIIGSITYEVWRTWTAGSTMLLPLISTNVLAGQGAETPYPLLRLLLDCCLGAVCGYLGGHWIKQHAFCNKMFKEYRLKTSTPAGPAPGSREPLLGEKPKPRWMTFFLNFQWRDLWICSCVTIINTLWAAYLPLLNGKPQPMLMNELFDKTLMSRSDTWAVTGLGLTGTLIMCCVMKWYMTIASLSLSMPTGVVAPTMIIGGLIGRVFGHLLPAIVVSTLFGVSPDSPNYEEEYGAFLARFAIIGAGCFCASVCRAFAMAITVFEVLALPNAVLPLCSSTIVAIYVANQVEMPFFDKNLAGRGLGGIPALTYTDHAEAPAFSIMKKVDVYKDCLLWKSRLFDMHELLKKHPDEEDFAVVRPIDDGECVLMGSMTRNQIDRLISALDPDGTKPDLQIDLMDPELQRPADGSEPYVEGCPPHVTPNTTVREIYLIMKVAHGENVVFVTRDGCLLGTITFGALMQAKK
mmetsp:Transcript_43466/g.93125  ORF Transcript_43466/g.93125 Transcript_43466/m.93125 type:complete len:740 (-) Transcript_43466:23-2242(-)